MTFSGYPLLAVISMLVYLATVLVLWRTTGGYKVKPYLLFAVLSIVLGWLCSRLLYCAVYPACFGEIAAAPLSLFSLSFTDNSMLGLLLGITVATVITAEITKHSRVHLLDTAALPVGLLLCGLRIAEGLTKELGIGRQVDAGTLTEAFPFLFVTEKLGTMELYRLAVFRYEAVFALLIFGLMLLYRRKAFPNRPGGLALLFTLLYCGGQLLFESMRDDGHMVLGFIRVQQVLALLIMLAVLWGVSRRYARVYHARNTVTAAWTLLPVAVMILWIMVAPVNHVLDLSGHIPLGIGLLAGIGLYLAFFLLGRGANPRLIALWLITTLAVAGCVLLEFSMDASAHLGRDYALLALCSLILYLCPCTLYHKLPKQEAA